MTTVRETKLKDCLCNRDS